MRRPGGGGGGGQGGQGGRGPAARQRGRSLVELMISIAIGLAIVVGVVAMYLSASRSARVSQQIGDVETLGSVLMSTLGPAIRMAGYGEIVSASLGPATLFDGPAVLGCENGVFRNVAAGDLTCDPGAVGSDALLVRFQSDNVRAARQTAMPIRDCLGGAAPNQVADPQSVVAAGVARPIVLNAFRLNASGELVCFGNGAGDEQPLLTGVEEFRVFFGFDDLGFAQARQSTYPNPSPASSSIRGADWINALAAAVPDVNPWNSVVAVHVCVRVRTAERALSTQASQSFAACPSSAEAASQPLAQRTASDGALRRTYLQTFTIQGRATGNLLNGLVGQP